MVLLLIVLAAIYLFNFTGLFRTPTIEISTRFRPQYNRHSSRSHRVSTVGENTVSFLLNGRYELTSVKVVNASDAKTNKYPHPLWHLISESNSIPTKALVYGIPVKGMKPEVEKIKPEPLQANTSYILLLEAGSLKGQANFTFH